MSDATQFLGFEVFPNPAPPDRLYTIEHTHEEWTSMCPKTGHPDFGKIIVRYVPALRCVELKSLKLWFHSFRDRGIFYEAVTNEIFQELWKLLEPRALQVVGEFSGRGGVHTTVTVERELVDAEDA